MNAIIQDRYGSPDVLQLREIDRPVVGDDEVLIRVHAAGIDQGVWHLMAGLPYLVRIAGFGLRAPKNSVRGLDVAGRVEAVGENVTEFQPGDEVFGTCNGSFAEYACAATERHVARVRRGWDVCMPKCAKVRGRNRSFGADSQALCGTRTHGLLLTMKVRRGSIHAGSGGAMRVFLRRRSPRFVAFLALVRPSAT
jgi:threonine dehydrogenase-like Zn-dependent dehydrogenase